MHTVLLCQTMSPVNGLAAYAIAKRRGQCTKGAGTRLRAGTWLSCMMINGSLVKLALLPTFEGNNTSPTTIANFVFCAPAAAGRALGRRPLPEGRAER